MINFVRVPKDYNSVSNVIIAEVLVRVVMKATWQHAVAVTSGVVKHCG